MISPCAPVCLSFISTFCLSVKENSYIHFIQKTTYSKPCLKRPLKIDKTKILMTNGSLMKVESIAECSPLGAFCNTFDLH